MHSSWLWASAGLAALAAAAEVVTTARQFGVVNVFPHNETYKPSDIMPIVPAIQNSSAVGSVESFSVTWQIVQFPEAHSGFSSDIPSSGDSGTMDYGDFQVSPNETSADTNLFLVNFTNVTHWIQYGPREPADDKDTPVVHGKYILQWTLTWWGLLETCGTKSGSEYTTGLVVRGALTFSIQTVLGEGGTGSQGEIHDVQEAISECPSYSGISEVGPPPDPKKPACPALERLATRRGSLCDARVDEAAASTISSLVSNSVSSYMFQHDPTTWSPSTAAATTATTLPWRPQQARPAWVPLGRFKRRRRPLACCAAWHCEEFGKDWPKELREARRRVSTRVAGVSAILTVPAEPPTPPTLPIIVVDVTGTIPNATKDQYHISQLVGFCNLQVHDVGYATK